MTLSDLLFVALVLVSAGVLLIAGLSLARGQFRRALRLLGGFTLGLTLYLGLVVAVSLLSAPREVAFGENRCFDDWCIAVEDVSRTTSATGATYTATLRLSNRARRVSQRANGENAMSPLRQSLYAACTKPPSKLDGTSVALPTRGRLNDAALEMLPRAYSAERSHAPGVQRA